MSERMGGEGGKEDESLDSVVSNISRKSGTGVGGICLCCACVCVSVPCHTCTRLIVCVSERVSVYSCMCLTRMRFQVYVCVHVCVCAHKRVCVNVSFVIIFKKLLFIYLVFSFGARYTPPLLFPTNSWKPILQSLTSTKNRFSATQESNGC